MKVNPAMIVVREGLDRWRKDMGDIAALETSILEYGQIQPIVITKANELVCGGRRLKAFLNLNKNISDESQRHLIEVVYREDMSAVQIRQLELEENIARKNFTPAEEVAAVAEIHRLLVEQHGQKSTSSDGGWSLQQTASRLGCSKRSVAQSIELAEAVEMFPQLKTAKTKKDIESAVRALSRQVGTLVAAETPSSIGENRLECIDAESLFASIESGTIDILHTDPPYGIDIETNKKNLPDTHLNSSFGDSVEEALKAYILIATESFRVVKDDGHAYVWLPVRLFSFVKEHMEAAGWKVYSKPLIWYKPNTGQAIAPQYWPGSIYDTCLYARKEKSILTLQGKSDLLTYSGLHHEKKVHMTEKPIEVVMDLLTRVARFGGIVLDPYAGSFSTAEAALRLNLGFICGDLNDKMVSLGKGRIALVQQELKA